MKSPILTLARLKEVMEYDPDTGHFRWKVSRRAGCSAGDIAGVVYPKGYRYIKIDQQRHGAHRLAMFYMIGIWPDETVDHINGQKDDNRFANLRLASWTENRMNSLAAGVKLYERQQKWKAYIGLNGKQIYLGMFDTRAEALAARKVAKAKYHGDFAPTPERLA
jgi:hypothetical protein